MLEIQQGNRELLTELWGGVRSFVAKQAIRRIAAYRADNRDCSVDVDDLLQEGFITMLRAVESYRAESGMLFLGWLNFHLKNAFNEALGLRRKQAFHEPTHYAVSMQQPIGNSEESTIGDLLLADGNEIELIEHEIWLAQLRVHLAAALAGLPVEWQYILEKRFWGELQLKQIADVEGVSPQMISEKVNRALRRLRKNDADGQLRRFVDY